MDSLRGLQLQFYLVRINNTILKSTKVLVAEVINENGFIPLGLFFTLSRKILSLFKLLPFEAKHAQKASYRLISPNSFFTDDFLDVSFDRRPAINQVFRIKGMSGKWLLIRRNSFDELYEEVIRKESKLNKGKVHSIDQLLKEEYPHLYVKEERYPAKMEILEVLEVD